MYAVLFLSMILEICGLSITIPVSVIVSFALLILGKLSFKEVVSNLDKKIREN